MYLEEIKKNQAVIIYVITEISKHPGRSQQLNNWDRTGTN